MSGARRLLFFCVRLAALVGASGVAFASSTPDDCVRRLAAIDSGGRVVFETVAHLTGLRGIAAAPLHPLERGGVHWDALELRPEAGGSGSVIAAASPQPGRNLALLRVDGADTCAAGAASGAASAPAPGSAVRLQREPRGFRPASIGGRVERVVDLGAGGRIALVHLLDEGGSDPGLVTDEEGRLMGATIPAPTGADPSLAAVVLEPAGAGTPAAVADTEWTTARLAIAVRPAPAVVTTPAGLVAQALLLSGRDGGARGIALLTAAIDQGVDLASVRLERGVLEFGAGLLPAATSDFERAAFLDQGSHLACFNLGVTLGAAGRYAEAAEAFTRARDLNPTHARTRYQLALALKLLHRDTEARGEAAALLSLDPPLARDLAAILGR